MQTKPTYEQLLERVVRLQDALTARSRTHFDEFVDGIGYVALSASEGNKGDQARLRSLLSILNVRKLRAAAMGLATPDLLADDMGLEEE